MCSESSRKLFKWGDPYWQESTLVTLAKAFDTIALHDGRYLIFEDQGVSSKPKT